METHHAHLNHQSGKKFSHYFYEFLMLFLAVFCGFLAENIREHRVEKERAEQYIFSFCSDLKRDTTRFSIVIKTNEIKIAVLENIFTCYDSIMKNFKGTSCLIEIARKSAFNNAVGFNDGTMQQLKNAGNLRLIQKNIVSDSIISYDVSVRALMWGTQDEENMMGTYRNIAEGIFDGVVLNNMRDDDNNVNRLDYNPPLRLTDDSKHRLNYRIHMLTVFNKTMRKEARKLLAQAQQLSELLKREYHLN